MTGGGLAMGRYEVTVGEYRAFASATGGGAGDGCFPRDSWRPGFPQTAFNYRRDTLGCWGRAGSASPTGHGDGEGRYEESNDGPET